MMREVIARGLLASGALRLVVNSRRRKAGMVLMYHAVNDQRNPFFPALDVATFEAQVAHLADFYRIVSLPELDAWLRSGEGGPPRVVITIDDGYPDTHSVAMPILRRHGAPATLFLNTEPLESGRRLWMDELSALVGYTRQAEVDCPPLAFGTATLATQRDRLRAREELGRRLKRAGLEVFERAFDHLRERLCDEDTERALPGVLDWDRVRDLQASGFTIGGHTHRHRILSRLSDDEARSEVATNLELIAGRLGARVECFAYPNGQAEDFTTANARLLAGLGVRYSVASTYGFVEAGFDPLAMRRLYCGEGSVATFAARVSGLREMLLPA
jgi:peptidoglycan/xylan/chitin deacetylase (PgdA/CDA1 family)